MGPASPSAGTSGRATGTCWRRSRSRGQAVRSQSYSDAPATPPLPVNRARSIQTTFFRVDVFFVRARFFLRPNSAPKNPREDLVRAIRGSEWKSVGAIGPRGDEPAQYGRRLGGGCGPGRGRDLSGPPAQ